MSDPRYILNFIITLGNLSFYDGYRIDHSVEYETLFHFNSSDHKHILELKFLEIVICVCHISLIPKHRIYNSGVSFLIGDMKIFDHIMENDKIDLGITEDMFREQIEKLIEKLSIRGEI